MSTHAVTAPSGLRLRSGPDFDQPILFRLPNGTTVDVLDASTDGWSRVRVALADGRLTGWVSAQWLEPLALAPPPEEPAWMTIARMEVGIQEYPDAQHNPRIIAYLRSTTNPASSDETPWCSAFANWCMAQAGTSGTGSARARSWLTWGRALSSPRPGCVTVFRRGNDPNAGHVAFFVAKRGAFIDVLGGNQRNSVRISSYYLADWLGYRWHA
ncbi:MAG: TIGR02594 family protein [Flavobacteriales bacterium]|nr:TIGR02594 family protein [Flavobacteriales bacterium]